MARASDKKALNAYQLQVQEERIPTRGVPVSREAYQGMQVALGRRDKPDSAREAATIAHPGQGQLVLISFFALILALLPLGLFLLVSANLEQRLLRHESSLRFSIVLQPQVDAAQAEELARQWRVADRDWFDAEVLEPTQAFSELDEATDWLDEPANAALVERQPYGILLEPRRLLSDRKNPDVLAARLLENEEVAEAYYDQQGLRRSYELLEVWGAVSNALWALGIALPLIAALLLGHFAERLARAARQADAQKNNTPSRLSRNPGAHLFLSFSGAATLLLLLPLWLVIRSLSPLEIFYLEPMQMLLLLLAGLLAGQLAIWFGLLLPGRKGRHVNTSVGAILLAILLKTAPAPAPAQTQTEALALPQNPSPREFALPSYPERAPDDLLPAQPPSDPEQRQSLLDENARRLDEAREMISQLQDLLTQGLHESRLDEDYLRRNSHLLQQASQRLDAVNRSITARERDIAASAELLVPLRMKIASRAQSAQIKGLMQRQLAGQIANQAARTARAVGIDRQRRQALQDETLRLRGENAVLRHFKQAGDHSEESIRRELVRWQEERDKLQRQRGILESTPAYIPEPPREISATPNAPQGALRLQENASPTPLNELYEQGEDQALRVFAPAGRLVHAVADGKVLHAGPLPGYGMLVYIDHGGGLGTSYGFLSEMAVRKGERVTKGQAIGAVGRLRPLDREGIRFEVRYENRLAPLQRLNQLQPATLLPLLLGLDGNE